MRVLFMGTPRFAARSLAALHAAGHTLCGAFCRADAPSGRGMKLTPPPVKTLAQELGLPVYQPVKLRDGAAAELIASLRPEVIAVVAYGRILPPEILSIAPCVNVHASLLPKYRGAAPVQWAIYRGEAVTGVTTMYMAEELDAGDMIFAEPLPITASHTGGTLYDELAELGAALLVKTLAAVADGTAPRIPQDPAGATYAPPVTKEHARLDWSRSPEELERQIRAFQPAPAAWTTGDGRVYKIHAAEVRGGKLEITRLQAPGGRAMDLADYLRGHTLPQTFL
jgi:methionyl-tRNA formyltransferase